MADVPGVIVFDLDGVLVDSRVPISRSNDALRDVAIYRTPCLLIHTASSTRSRPNAIG